MTPHFQYREFWRHGVEPPPSVIPQLRELAEQLEVMRAQLGGPRIVITRHGGWRSVEINRDVGGATRSQHLFGRAADIVVWSGGHVVVPRDVADVVLRLMRSGAIIAGGVGVYSGFTHVDTRGRVTTW